VDGYTEYSLICCTAINQRR